MKRLTEIIQNHTISLTTLAAAFVLEEAYIGITRNLVVSSYESFCDFLAKSADIVYHTIYNFH